jgi:hypothetical protein
MSSARLGPCAVRAGALSRVFWRRSLGRLKAARVPFHEGGSSVIPSRAGTLVAIALAFSGCSEGKRIPAVGPGYEIVVLASSESVALGQSVERILSREIVLVREEPTFEVVLDRLEEFSFYKTRKLLFAVGAPESKQLKKLLRRATGTKARTSFPGLWIVTEPFSAGQILFVLSGPPGALIENLEKRADSLLEIVEEAATTLLLTNLFRAGEKPGAREDMIRRWGWGVRLHPDWVVDDRFASQRFVRVWRDAPVAQLFVSWEEGKVDRSPVGWLVRRNDLGARFYDGDTVVYERSSSEQSSTPFEIEGLLMKGVWENEKYVIGGPFKSWAFYCLEDDRTYLVDLSVYAPDRSKRPLERTLEAVARTFRCGCVPKPARGHPS